MKHEAEIKMLKEIEARKGEWRVFHTEKKGKRVTIAAIRINGEYQIGYSECSKKDSWNRKIGRTIALGRALLQWRIWLCEKRQYYNRKTKKVELIDSVLGCRRSDYRPLSETSTAIPEILKIKNKEINIKPCKAKSEEELCAEADYDAQMAEKNQEELEKEYQRGLPNE